MSDTIKIRFSYKRLVLRCIDHIKIRCPRVNFLHPITSTCDKDMIRCRYLYNVKSR